MKNYLLCKIFNLNRQEQEFNIKRARVLTSKFKSFIFLNKNYCRYIYIFST